MAIDAAASCTMDGPRIDEDFFLELLDRGVAVGLPRIGVSSACGNGKRVLPVLVVIMFAMWQGSLALLGKPGRENPERGHTRYHSVMVFTV
jgi:hypothetical protein